MRHVGWIVVLALGCKSSDPAPSPDPVVAPAGSGSAGSAKHSGTDRHKPVMADAPPLEVGVSIKGVASKWDKAAFEKVPRYKKGTDGDMRDVWDLHDLVHVLVGSNARVVSVTGEGGSKPFDRAAWDDTTKTPVLHTTRRGTLKWTWADAGGKWGETEVKDVTQLVIEP
jgi:hypothetical protein